MTLLVGEGYGRVVGLRGAPDQLGEARLSLPFWWQPSTREPEKVYDISSPGSTEIVVRALEHWVAEHAVGFTFVHAAVAAVDDRLVMLPGSSFAGKTTLCAELLRQGATYFSDEYAVIGPEGLIHPYPRPLHVREPGGRVLLTPAALGSHVAENPLPVHNVALIVHDPIADWHLKQLPGGLGVLRVLEHTVSAQSQPAASLTSVVAAVAGSNIFQGTRGAADTAASALIAMLRTYNSN